MKTFTRRKSLLFTISIATVTFEKINFLSSYNLLVKEIFELCLASNLLEFRLKYKKKQERLKIKKKMARMGFQPTPGKYLEKKGCWLCKLVENEYSSDGGCSL